MGPVVPGSGDHDFYIDVAATAVLVHNCEPGEINGYTRHGLNQAISRDGVGVSPSRLCSERCFRPDTPG